MNQYAMRAQAFVQQNPRLAALKGFADAERADWVFRKNDRYVAAIDLLTRAIAEGGDHASFYRLRGDSFASLNRYRDAIEDLERADQLWPQSPATLELLAKVLLWMGKRDEALNKINLALALAGSNPDEEQIRTSILMQLKQNSPGKAAAGGD